VALASNEVSDVPDLTALTALQFLDLSDNRIDDFDPGQ
jgi:Leucine-rich repeat (LRR) protein